MTKIKVLFIDSVHPILQQKLEYAGFICDFRPELKNAEILEVVPAYDGIIIRSKLPVDKAFMDAAKNLKFIARSGSGLENIDVAYAEKKGIKCFNSPEGNRDAVGEHALGMLLALMNNMCRANTEVRNGIWRREENRGYEIKGKTVAIIGYGNMGNAFARRLRGFDCKVIAYDKYKFDYTDRYCRETTMQEIQERADILSLHVPLTKETTYLVDNDYLSKFRKDIFLVNTSRGNVVKTEDLVQNLKSGKVIGAALDVLEYETASFETIGAENMPEPFKYLVNSDKVILTPHVAGWTQESNVKLAEVLSDKIIANFGNVSFL
jgi:D-3-phosphoglycerate dehydrogenase / 2-oxoglutarate reductase